MSILSDERKSLGLPVRTSDPMASVTGDNELFKYALITPHEPHGLATFEIEKQVSDGNGGVTIKKEEYKRNVPHLVSTMALGNLNTKEVALARIYAEMARVCAWHGYQNLAIDYYLKWVHLNVTSQSYQAQLLRQILTETVSVSRKEESLAGTHDFNADKKNKLGELVDKWKNKDSSQFMGQNSQGYQQMGLK